MQVNPFSWKYDHLGANDLLKKIPSNKNRAMDSSEVTNEDVIYVKAAYNYSIFAYLTSWMAASVRKCTKLVKPASNLCSLTLKPHLDLK